MTEQSFLLRYPLLFFIIIISLLGCNNNDADKNKDSAEPATTDSATAGPVVAAFSGKLDVLWAPDTGFIKQDDSSKIVFQFTLGKKDTLTLHGWNVKPATPNGFDSLPDIRLYKLKPGGETFGPGTYFGNVVLRKKGFQEIKDSLLSTYGKYKFVVFTPKKDPDGHIKYEISVTKDAPTIEMESKLLTGTKASANPSPPKIY